jgi:hypothetical protein
VGAGARGADPRGGLLDLAARARGEPDFGAGLREGERAGAADAAAGAGDERVRPSRLKRDLMSIQRKSPRICSRRRRRNSIMREGLR